MGLHLCFSCRQPASYMCLACREEVCVLCAPTEEHSCGVYEDEDDEEAVSPTEGS